MYLVGDTPSNLQRRQPYAAAAAAADAGVPAYHAKRTSGIDVVITLLTIPFVGVLVCVAHSLADGAPASSISEMVTNSRDMEIVFGIAMGASALSISMAMWILKWRIVGTRNADVYCFMPSLFLVLTILMIFGCGALARHTLKDDAGSHVLYATMAFVSQLLMLVMLDVAALRVCRMKALDTKITWRVQIAMYLTGVAALMLVLFGASVSTQPYYFEFALLACMYLASCSLATENWYGMHCDCRCPSGTVQGGGGGGGSVIITQRPQTRFDVV